jgi:hypothetical protein
VSSTGPCSSVVCLQRKRFARSKYFAQEKGVWCNSVNFPKGGWPGDPGGSANVPSVLLLQSARQRSTGTGAPCLTLEKLA